ncbi:hypothetical protein JKP88DRAFT_354607 [Tribonema minus]|uniref:Plastocyanin-like domain-containing protein n=1 Tax=Tribonema minus TaxID=303371 RepID=A0A835YXW7_9STRA|nr:hypothetical protein JKP88DRAFT_354607 [Tribonema minus]
MSCANDGTFTVIVAGDENEYIYTVSCDHSGGTNWYHPHFHGSSALQTNGGAAGMLIIEPGVRESADTPMLYQSLPEQYLIIQSLSEQCLMIQSLLELYLIIQDFSVQDLTAYSLMSGDAVFDTNIQDPFATVNGCTGGSQVINVEAGQWTRLRTLHSGNLYNAIVTIEPAAAGANTPLCDVVLLQKDGAWLGTVPRTVQGTAPGEAPALFFTPSSRNDVAVRCAGAGAKHEIRYAQVNNALRADPEVIATLEVSPSTRPPAADLPQWSPCRPAYLQDLTGLTPQQLGNAYPIELRQTINNAQFSGPEDYMHELELAVPEQWLVTGTDLHPLHVHVNHFQIGKVTAANQWAEAPEWLQEGDYMDSLSAKGSVQLLVRPERFSGVMIIHCHITSHADQGMMAVFNIKGKGADALSPPQVAAGDFGTCPFLVPQSAPFRGTPATIPGVIEAEQFDTGGQNIAYWNDNTDDLAGPVPPRSLEAVEVVASTDGATTSVTSIRAGEWLKYTVNVEQTGTYGLTMFSVRREGSTSSTYALVATLSTGPGRKGVSWSLWSGQRSCPTDPKETTGLVSRVADSNLKLSDDADVYGAYVAPEPAALTAGPQTLLLCFDKDMVNARIDSLALRYCAASAALCAPRLAAAAAAAAARNDALLNPVAPPPPPPAVPATEPVPAKPVPAKPVAAKPVAAKPVAAKPVAAKPVAAKPVAAKPVAAKPVAAKPVAETGARA